MTTQNSNIFDRLTEHRGAPAEMLDEMVSHFRDTRSPMELFEALKMRIRDKLGLPLVSNDNEPSRPEDVERQLEVGLWMRVGKRARCCWKMAGSAKADVPETNRRFAARKRLDFQN